MNTLGELWKKLNASKSYREEFVAVQLKRGIPFQIRTLMKQKKLSQEELARRAGLTQGVVSRAANPNYGNLTLNTLIRIAAGFDLAFVGKFVPFRELGTWFLNLSEDSVAVPSFGEDTPAEPIGPQVERGERRVAIKEAVGGRVIPINRASASEEHSLVLEHNPQPQMESFFGGANVDVPLPPPGSTQGSNAAWQQA